MDWQLEEGRCLPIQTRDVTAEDPHEDCLVGEQVEPGQQVQTWLLEPKVLRVKRGGTLQLVWVKFRPWTHTASGF